MKTGIFFLIAMCVLFTGKKNSTSPVESVLVKYFFFHVSDLCNVAFVPKCNVLQLGQHDQ